MEPHPSGGSLIRPYLTPRDCADLLHIQGVTAAYIRSDIRDGLLPAEIIERPIRPGRQRSHPIIRVYPEDFRAYVAQYWPRFAARVCPDYHMSETSDKNEPR